MGFKRQKIARAILAVVLLLFAGTIFFFIYRQRTPGTNIIIAPGEKTKNTAVLEGLDVVRTEGNRKIFEVKAKKHFLDDKGIYQLQGGIEIKIFGKNAGDSAVISAERGHYDGNFLGLYLEGDVIAKLETGLKLVTDSLRYIKDKDLIRSSDAVRFERGNIAGHGVGLTIDVTSKIVEFIHRVEFNVRNLRSDLPADTQILSRYMHYDDRAKVGIFQQGVEVTNADSFLRSEEVEFTLVDDGSHIKDMEARFGVQADFASSARGTIRREEDERCLSSMANSPGQKTLTAEMAHLTYADDGKRIADAVAQGHAVIETRRQKDEKIISRRRIAGDKIHFVFFANKDGIEKCEANGDVAVEIVQEGKTRKDRVLKRVYCDAMTASFDPVTEEASQMLFTGKVRFEDQDSKAYGEKGTYDGKLRLLTITEGNPRVEREGNTVSAQKIEINETSGILKATNDVRTNYLKRSGEISFFGNADDPVSLSATSMTYDPTKGLAIFTGDGRAWQGDNIITAAQINVDQGQNTFSASTGVKSVLFSSVPKKGEKEGTNAKERVPITVTSEQLLYTEKTRSMTYTTNVVLHREEADMKSDKCEVFFQKNANDIDRMQSTGNVVITQPGKQIFGQTADYDLFKDMVMLTGKPKVIDIVRGTSQGKLLTYFFQDGKIILDGKMEGRTTTIYQPDLSKH